MKFLHTIPNILYLFISCLVDKTVLTMEHKHETSSKANDADGTTFNEVE